MFWLIHISIIREYTQRSYLVKEYIPLSKVQVKFALEQAMKSHRGGRCVALFFP